MRFNWNDIAQAPNKPGIYAWYCAPRLTRRDVRDAIERIEAQLDASNEEGAAEIVREFLRTHIMPHKYGGTYSVRLSGRLMPEYSGEIEQTETVSSSLVERLAQRPQKLGHIESAFGSIGPEFMSPLYIGKAERTLRERLLEHKIEIETAQAKRLASPVEVHESGSFAQRFCALKLPVSSLFAVTWPVCADCIVEMENLLNRVVFPKLGEN